MSVRLCKSVHEHLQPDFRVRSVWPRPMDEMPNKAPCTVCGELSFYVLPDNIEITYCADHAAELQLVINRLRGHE